MIFRFFYSRKTYKFFQQLQCVCWVGKIRFSGTWNSMLLKACSGECSAPHNIVLLLRLGGTLVHLIVYLLCTKWNRLWKDKCLNKFMNSCIYQNDLIDMKTLRNIDVSLVSPLLTSIPFLIISLLNLGKSSQLCLPAEMKI